MDGNREADHDATGSNILSALDRAGIRRAHLMRVSLGGMVAQELAADHPERVGDLIPMSTTPGWPFAYPMPAASAALIARTGSLTREVAARCHAENALSARTVLERPEVADRLVAFQGTRPAEPRALAAPATAGAGGRCCTPATEALSFDAVAIRVNGRTSRNFSVEESARREAEVSEVLIIIVVGGHGVGPEEVR